MKLKKHLLLIMLLALVIPAKSQIYRRTADGRDSIQSNVVFTTDKLHNYQYHIQYKEGDTMHLLLPEDGIAGVKIQNKTFLNVRVQRPDGTVTRMFAHRIQALDNMPVLYNIYDEKDKPTTYAQIKGGVLVPLKSKPVEPDDALHNELVRLNDSLGGNAYITNYLRELKPTRRNMIDAQRVINSQNPNFINRIRWGVGVGMAFSSLSADLMIVEKSGIISRTLDPVSQTQAMLSLFVDIPSGHGVSIHPELTLRKASLHQQINWAGNRTVEEVYNCTMLELPMMLRYTYFKLRGKWLPYAEAGIHFGYLLRDEHQSRMSLFDEEGYFNHLELTTEDGSGIRFQPAVGAGVEFRYAERHAAFLSARYVINPAYDPSKTLTVKQNAFMINLSFNL